jgi:hypothetical protein
LEDVIPFPTNSATSLKRNCSDDIALHVEAPGRPTTERNDQTLFRTLPSSPFDSSRIRYVHAGTQA